MPEVAGRVERMFPERFLWLTYVCGPSGRRHMGCRKKRYKEKIEQPQEGIFLSVIFMEQE
jgi:hypothetical protein